MNIQSIALDVNKKASTIPVLRLRQGDRNGTTLSVEMYDGGTALDLTGYAVKFCMRIPGGAGMYETAGTVSGNVATFTIDETYAAAAVGETCVAYVRIEQGETFACSTGNVHVVILEDADE